MFFKRVATELSWHGVLFLVATAIVSWVSTAAMTPEHDLNTWLTYGPLLGPFVTGFWFGARTGTVKSDMHPIWRLVLLAFIPSMLAGVVSSVATALALPPQGPGAAPHYLWASGDPLWFMLLTAPFMGLLGWIVGLLLVGVPFLAHRDPGFLLTGHQNPNKVASPAARRLATLVAAAMFLAFPTGILLATGLEVLGLEVLDVDIPGTFSSAWGVLNGSGESARWLALAAGMILILVNVILLLLVLLAKKDVPADERGASLLL